MYGILYDSSVRFSLFITFTSAPSSRNNRTNSTTLSNWFSFNSLSPMTSKAVFPFASLRLHQNEFCEHDAIFSLLITSLIFLNLRNQFSLTSPAKNNVKIRRMIKSQKYIYAKIPRRAGPGFYLAFT